MANLCVIPARGGSKRIVNKNIKDFLGKPIIRYSIETALNCGLFDEVMVSTDDQEIARVAKDCGAFVPFMRSAENSDDFATTAQVVDEVISKYRDQGNLFDYICCVYPTAPLVQQDDLIEGYERLREGYDTVFPIVSYSYPIWRGLRINKQGCAEMIWPENLSKRSQDFEPVYHDAGQWYWLRSSSFAESKKLYSANSYPILLSDLFVQDIDNLSDWEIAEIKFKIIKNGL